MRFPSRLGVGLLLFVCLAGFALGAADRQVPIRMDPKRMVLDSSYVFISEHARFVHSDMPVSGIHIIMREPRLTENGWEVLARVTGRSEGKEIARDLLLYVDPDDYTIRRLFVAKTQTFKPTPL